MTKRIAIIDNDPHFVRLLQDILRDAAYETVSTCHEADCDALIVQTQPDLMILNMRMQHPTSGWQMVQHLRQRPRTSALPLIMVSGDSGLLAALEPQLRAAACFMIPKPFILGTFLQTIQSALQTGPSNARHP